MVPFGVLKWVFEVEGPINFFQKKILSTCSATAFKSPGVELVPVNNCWQALELVWLSSNLPESSVCLGEVAFSCTHIS